MKNTFLLGILLFVLVIAIPPSGSAAEPKGYHDLLSAGIVRLNQNDLGGAMQQFKQALAENPQGVEAFYYIGVTQARAGQIDEAEKNFKEALARDATFLPAHFDLGVLYYQKDQDEAALKEFDTVQRADPDRARVYYYQGLILRRMGKSKEAAAKMEKAASLDPDLALEANYHAGSAYYEAGELEAARKSFQNVVTLLPEGETAQSASDYLERIDAQARHKRPWDLTFSAGVQYDSNVILEPTRTIPSTPQTITEKSDLVGLVFLRGRYQWLSTPEWTGRAEYSFYQNLHKDDQLNDFNIQSHTVNLSGGRRFSHAELLLQYELQFATLGGDRYLLRQGVGPRFVLETTRRNITEFLYQFGAKNFYDIEPLFPSNSDRNVHTHKAGFTHYFLFGPKGNLHAGYYFERETAGDSPAEDDWTFNGHRLAAGAVLPPWQKWTLALDTEYVLRRFTHPNEQPPGEKRKDDDWLTIVTLSREITKQVDFALQFLHQQNSSNITLFEYDRNIYGGIVTVRF